MTPPKKKLPSNKTLAVAASIATIVGTLIAAVTWLEGANKPDESKTGIVAAGSTNLNGANILSGNKNFFNHGSIQIQPLSDVDNDPRAVLRRLGINWSYHNFEETLRQKDLRSLDLFLKGGMHLDGMTFWNFIRVWYDQKTAELISGYQGAVDGNPCLTTSNGTFEVRVPVRENLERVRFAKQFCASVKVMDWLRLQVERHKKDLIASRWFNANRGAVVQNCMIDLRRKYTVERFLEDASHFVLFSRSTLSSPTDFALADMNSKILFGSARGDQRQAYEASIRKGCESANPPRPDKDEDLAGC